MSPRDPDVDLLIAQLVLERGLAKPEHVQECLRLQGELASNGVQPIPQLGEIMVRKGYLSEAQLRLATRSESTPASHWPFEAIEAAKDPANRFGQYVLVGRAGVGGMGEVWRAWDGSLGRWVALKFLKFDRSESLARFQREAHAAARISHPNIASVYEVGAVGGRHYIAMQYVAGPTLRAFPRNDIRLLTEVMRDGALAVQAAHESGILHRDLKPENIMVEEASGGRLRVFVLDFGLAKEMTVDSSLSSTGVVVGTPAYMSPEQMSGLAPVDARSDVWSLGATLYELLADRPPFPGSELYDVFRKIVEEEPESIRKVRPQVDRELETIALKCLEKDPKRRYATPRELAEDLTRWLAGEPIRANPPSTLYRFRKAVLRRKSILAIAVLGAVGIATVGSFGARQWVRSRRAEWARAAEEHRTRDALAAKARVEHEALRRLAAQKVYEEATRALWGLRLHTYSRSWRMTPQRLQEFAAIKEKCARQMKETGPTADAWWVVGRAEHLLGDEAAALRAYDEGLRLEPEHGSCLLYKARILIENSLIREYFPKEEGFDEESPSLAEAERLLERGSAGRSVSEMELDLARGYRLVLQRAPVQKYVENMLEKWKDSEFREEFYLIRGLGPGTSLITDAGQAISARPGAYEPYVWRAMSYFVNQLHASAVEDLLAALQRNPNSSRLHLLLAWVRYYKGEFEPVAAGAARALELEPELPDAHIVRGLASARGWRLREAIEDFTHAIRLRPLSALAHSNRAHASLFLGRKDDALRDADRAVRLRPQYAGARYVRAKARFEYRDLNGAILDCDEVLRQQPTFLSALELRGAAKASLGRFREALSDYSESIRLGKSVWFVYFSRARMYRLLNDFERSLMDCHRALELSPSQPAVLALRGRIRLAQGDLEGSVLDALRALRVHAGWPGVQGQLTEGLSQRGLREWHRGRYAPAIGWFSQALVLDPACGEAYLRRGRLRVFLREPDGAIADASRGIALRPKSNLGYNTRGIALFEKDEFLGAIADSTQALLRNPRLVEAFYNRAVSYLHLGRPLDTIHDATLALQLSPTWADAYGLRAIAFCDVGDRKRALGDARRAIKLGLRPHARRRLEAILPELLR